MYLMLAAYSVSYFSLLVAVKQSMLSVLHFLSKVKITPDRSVLTGPLKYMSLITLLLVLASKVVSSTTDPRVVESRNKRLNQHVEFVYTNMIYRSLSSESQ